MGKAMEDMTNCTYLKYIRLQNAPPSPSVQTVFLFVTSVARINFEIEVVQRGGSLCVPSAQMISLMPKRDCTGEFLQLMMMLFNDAF